MAKSKIDCPPNPVLAAAYLEHIVISIRVDDRTKGIFRSFLDPWYAYTFGGPFLRSRSGIPIWPNKPCPVKDRELLLAADWISTAARSAIETQTVTRLVLDHSVPIAKLIERMKECRFQTPGEVDDFLRLWYRRGVIMKGEDDLLNLKWKGDMPSGWDWVPGSEFERYRSAGIPGGPT